MTKLRPLLLETGVPSGELHEWTSHAFRRGSGVDMLEERGVQAMLRHGDWSDRQAAQPYASADEQAAVSLASACQFVGVSDDDM